MPEARADMAVAAVGLDIYQIGGETAAGVDGKVNVFNSRDRVWRTAADKPTAVSDSSAVELYGEIYVPGGIACRWSTYRCRRSLQPFTKCMAAHCSLAPSQSPAGWP